MEVRFLEMLKTKTRLVSSDLIDPIPLAEEQLDMRKPLPRDIGKRSVRPNGRDVLVSAADVS